MSAYWRDGLLGVEPLELPSTDRVTSRPSYRGGSVAVPIGAELSQSLNEFARSTARRSTLCSGGLPGTFVSNHRAARFCRRLASKLAHCYVERHDRLLRRPAADARPCRWRTPHSVWLGRVRAAAFGALRHEHPFVLIAEDFVHVRDVVPLSFQAAFTLQQARSDAHHNRSLQLVTEGDSVCYFGDVEAELVRSRLELRPSICRSRSRRPMAASRPSCSTRRTCSIPTLRARAGQFRTLLSSVVVAPNTQ